MRPAWNSPRFLRSIATTAMSSVLGQWTLVHMFSFLNSYCSHSLCWLLTVAIAEHPSTSAHLSFRYLNGNPWFIHHNQFDIIVLALKKQETIPNRWFGYVIRGVKGSKSIVKLKARFLQKNVFFIYYYFLLLKLIHLKFNSYKNIFKNINKNWNFFMLCFLWWLLKLLLLWNSPFIGGWQDNCKANNLQTKIKTVSVSYGYGRIRQKAAKKKKHCLLQIFILTSLKIRKP